MFQDIRLHGQINDKVEYYATVAGRQVSTRYFHESGEKNGIPYVRFFSSANEFRLTPDGINYRANGGSFCEYMFDIDLPLKDLAKKEVLNRLVMFGAVYDKETDGITFTDDLYGEESYEKVFMNGNAVGDYYFFVHTDTRHEPEKRQESLLRLVGKYLKYTDKVGKADDSSLVREIFLALREEKSVLFLIRLVHRYHDEYYRSFRELYYANRTVDEDGASRLAAMADLYEIDRYNQERIKIDVMYKHPENKRIVDEYKGILLECTAKDELDHLDMARLTRLRTLSIRHRIPLNLFDTLDEMLLKGKKIRELHEPEYIKETRSIFEGLFLSGHGHGLIDDEDMVKLLLSKQRAIEHRDNAFEEMLLETCRLTDERSIESDDMALLENFGYIVTYFDRFDNTLAAVSKVCFMEDTEVDEERLRSLVDNKRAFDKLAPDLFHELFIKGILANRYLTGFGRRKASILHEGILEVLEGDSSLKEVADRLSTVVKEERHYGVVHSFMRDKIKRFYSDLSDMESQEQFIAESWKEMLDKGLVQNEVPEKVFRDAVLNIRKEAFYLHNLLPVIIAGKDSRLRDDFLENSGLDRFYVEDLEREYFEKNGLSHALLERIRK